MTRNGLSPEAAAGGRHISVPWGRGLGFRREAVLCGALVAALMAGGCTDCQGGGGQDALPADVCNSLDEALTNGDCEIAENADHLDYISFPNDKDWFSLRTPATMDARSLLRVTGGYGVPATPVQLAVNVLREDGNTSVGRVVDLHGQGAPQPLQILTRFTEPNARLVMLLNDQPSNLTQPQSDPRSAYLVKWDVLQDPDPNEPNDTTATAIPTSGTPITGSATGILATPDDQDRFSISVPAGKVLYFHIGEASPAPKPINYRLAWTLYDPSMVQVGEGRVDNVFLEIDLATARLIATQGTYTIAIHAYREPNSVGQLPGDERLTYKIDALIVDQLDTNEPNNTLSDANGRAVSLAPGTTRSFTGRIGYVSDPDWYAVDVASDTQPRVLHYQLLPPTGTGRFPPLPLGPSGPDREVAVVTVVTQGTQACRTDPALCPKGYGANPSYQLAVEQVCARSPAQCLWSDREEDFQYPNFLNFEGRVPVAPHATSVRYYLVVQDVGNDWADDRNYTLQVSLEADPDENTRLGFPGETQPAALAQDTSGATFPVPPAGATSVSGTITHGYGRLYANDPTLGQGIRGPADYDAVATDIDRYELDIPFIDPASGPLDRTWELQWSVQNVDGGAPPHGLFLEVEFCDGTQTPSDGGTCASVTTSRGGAPLVFAYDGANRASWWNNNPAIPYQPLWQQAGSATTARAYGCFCFERRFVQGGKLFVKVGALDRNSWGVSQYTVRTAFTSYPQAFAAFGDGGTTTCPAVVDGGMPPPPPDAGVDAGTTDGGYGLSGGCEFTR